MLRDDDLGYAQVTLLPRWRPAAQLNEQAGLQAIDPLLHRYLLVVSESRDDFDANMNVDSHAALTIAALAASVKVVGLQGPVRCHLKGRPAVQYELEAFHDQTRLKYLHTTIAGDRAFHQVLAWAPYSKYDRAVFEQLLNGFDELPGPMPNPTSPALLYEGPPQSRYDVH